MSSKRKAADFFKDIEVGDCGQSNSQSTRTDNAPVSKAELLKEARRKQLLEAVSSDTSRNDRASEYQSRSYSQWTRPDTVNAAHSYRFEEKYSTFASDDRKSTQKSASNKDNSSYFDRQEQRHNDAMFSRSRRNEMSADESDNDSSDDDRRYKKRNGGGSPVAVEERIPITSFSKEDSSPPSSSAAASSFVPQSKFAQKLYSKDQSRECEDVDDDSLPLYKRIKKNDRVIARYSVNGQFYPARVKTVMHSGYSSAQYDIVFDFYDKVHTVGWTDIREIVSNTGPVPLSSSGGSGTAAPPPPAPLPTKVEVEVSELSQPSTAIYHTVAGVPIKTIRYDSATGKAVINEEPSPAAPPSLPSSLLASNPLLASKISGIVSRINSGVGGATASATSTTAAPPAPTPPPPAAPQPVVVSRFERVMPSVPSIGSSGTSLDSILSGAGATAAAAPLVNPKLAQRAKGNWKLAKTADKQT